VTPGVFFVVFVELDRVDPHAASMSYKVRLGMTLRQALGNSVALIRTARSSAARQPVVPTKRLRQRRPVVVPSWLPLAEIRTRSPRSAGVPYRL